MVANNRNGWWFLLVAVCSAVHAGLAPAQESPDAQLPTLANCPTDNVSQDVVDAAVAGEVTDDILVLADQSLEDLARHDVIVPALQEVVSTVSRQQSTVGRTPAAVYVVTTEMIRRSGAQTIADALRLVPGLNFAQRDASRWAISARGLNMQYANKLLVQIDGRSVYTPVFGGTYWDSQDLVLADIERIEVIRGPGATAWGANAVNGVVNIITRSAKDTCGVYAKGGGGSEEKGFATARVGGCQGDLAWRAYGKWFERDGGVAVGGPTYDDWRQKRAGFRTDWTPDSCDTVTVQGDAYVGTSGSVFLGFSENVDELDGHNLLARWTRTMDDDSDCSLQAYYDVYNRTGLSLDQHVEVFDIDFQHRLPVGQRHKVVWGLSYRRIYDCLETIPPGVIVITPTMATNQLFSGFVQDEVALCQDALYLTVGSKLEKNDYTDFEVQPSIRLLWLPSDRSAAWGAISRAVRIPSRREMHSWTHAFVRTYGPSPLLDSEEVIAYELGYRVQPTERYSWDLALFYNVYENLRSWRQVGFGFPPNFTLVNGARDHAYGFELSCKYQATACWNLTAWYNFVQIEGHELPTVLPMVTRDEGSTPNHQVFLMSSWDLRHDVEFDLMARYVDALPAQSVPSYISLDLRLGWRPTNHMELSVVGQDLLDSQHLEFGNVGAEPTPLVEVQRGVFGMVTWEY